MAEEGSLDKRKRISGGKYKANRKNKNNPFLLYLPYNTPHSPMQVPDENWIKFKDL